jgi:hypothetical protein
MGIFGFLQKGSKKSSPQKTGIVGNGIFAMAEKGSYMSSALAGFNKTLMGSIVSNFKLIPVKKKNFLPDMDHDVQVRMDTIKAITDVFISHRIVTLIETEEYASTVKWTFDAGWCDVTVTADAMGVIKIKVSGVDYVAVGSPRQQMVAFIHHFKYRSGDGSCPCCSLNLESLPEVMPLENLINQNFPNVAGSSDQITITTTGNTQQSLGAQQLAGLAQKQYDHPGPISPLSNFLFPFDPKKNV